MPSFSTTYDCRACQKRFPVEVQDLGDPHEHIPRRSEETLRRIRETENQLGLNKPADPINELAQKLLEQEAQSVLLRAACPECKTKNPEGIAADRAERRQSFLTGNLIFAVVAVAAYFYPKVALILPGMDLLVFRPILYFQGKKILDKPFPVGTFVLGILIDIGLITLILLYPPAAPFIPLAGILQSIYGYIKNGTKYDWRWEESEKKLRFGTAEIAAS